MMKNPIQNLGKTALKLLPCTLTLALLLFLILLQTGTAASAENAAGTEDSEDSLPEYSITLSDAGISTDCESIQTDGSTLTITDAGSYTVSGSLSNGQLRVDAGKDSKVRLILNGVSITNSSSAAIYVLSADKLIISLEDGSSNALSTAGSFVQTDDNNVDAVIFSKDDVTIKGSGSLTVYTSSGHGIVSKDDLKIKGGSITVTSGRKALSCNELLEIDDGTLTLDAGTEGMEAAYILINGGSISIQAKDDGINATLLSDSYSPLVEINGGSVSVVMGSGDTDGIDSNGGLTITGGTVSVSGNSAFDIDGTISYTGGTVIINGKQVDSIPNQMMGGFGGMGRGGMQNMQGLDGNFNNGGGFPGQEGSGNLGGQQSGGFGGMNGGHHGMGGMIQG